MKVRELIQELQKHDSELEVCFDSDGSYDGPMSIKTVEKWGGVIVGGDVIVLNS